MDCAKHKPLFLFEKNPQLRQTAHLRIDRQSGTAHNTATPFGLFQRRAIFSLYQVPSRAENKPADVLHLAKMYFFYLVGGLVVVFVCAVEVENDGNVVLGKIIVVGTVVKLVGVVFVVVGVIEFDLGGVEFGYLLL